MNKTLIALAVSAAAVATGANAAEIYNNDGNSIEMGGRAEARMSLKDGKAEDKTRVRLNFLGKAQISDNLYGLGFYEGEFTTKEQGQSTDSDANNLTNRLMYAGLGGAFGEVAYGKTEGALGVITDFTDIMAYHGNSAAYKIAVADRTDNMLAYKGQFSDLSLKASYRFADATDEGTDGYKDNNANGYSLSAIYAIGDTGVKLGAGYADADQFVKVNNSNVLFDRSEYMLVASYEINDLYFAGAYVDGQDKVKTSGDKTDNTGYEFAAKYTLGQTVLSTTYNKLEAKTSGTKSTAADNVAVDATYYFKPNFRGYASYNFNLLKAGDNNGNVTKAQAEDEIALGLRYDF
ncbi:MULTISPECIES: porin [Vibrio oreintalis group]|uniref:porin n=1 Tax=Vibrio oreintalis group TaxID=1891919 RepID=UPI00148B5E30|nr:MULTISPECIES: porin [Vibrio oreintalis group]MCG9574673.1 porin [Vibrio tubiashii]MDC5820926.1 porin [Vibrio europaeus]MDC5838375.1 porin [Vibrio europaeus]MDC5851039.1 porin [Vibrio europaeus]MDC5854971.1 porin [Vibrio europaeus]